MRMRYELKKNGPKRVNAKQRWISAGKWGQKGKIDKE